MSWVEEITPPAIRFWTKVDFDGPVPEHRPELGPCWLWTAHKLRGYGRFRLGETTIQAHRYAYEFCVGPIPNGLTIDHLCRVHNCVLPDHLEPVTQSENVRRGARYSGSPFYKRWSKAPALVGASP